MTDHRPDASSITDDQLDALYAAHDAAHAELDRLATEAAEGLAGQTMLKGLDIRDGQVVLEVEPARELLLTMVASMRTMLDDAGAENYLVTEATFPPAVHLDLQDGQHPEDSYTLTIQRRHRPTAHDLRRKAEVRAEQAEVRLAAARALADRAEHGATRWADPLPVPEWVGALRAVLDGPPAT